jgi:molecular chaperone HtpG
LGDLTIEIEIDEQAKTLTIKDRGIGMKEEEVKKYLNQVAFSSAEEFVKKYKAENTIIGHFGLGFYSAFMVADRVEVITKSYRKNARAVRWECEGEPEYGIEPAERKERGTDVILHINEESKEFLEKHRIENLLKKYCRFCRYPLSLAPVPKRPMRVKVTKLNPSRPRSTTSSTIPNLPGKNLRPA